MSAEVSTHGAQRRRVLAGSSGDERRPARPEEGPAWYEPLHIRAPGASRKTLIEKLSAGADVLLAPTWLTHPWAASRVGEGRRSRAWTIAAVGLAREATEERDAPTLVAGPVPRLLGLDDGTTGRRPTLEASFSAALRHICGTLAEAGVDLLLVEDQGSLAGWREALRTAVDTGLPVWAELPDVGRDVGEDAGPWLEAAAGAGDVQLLAVVRGSADEAVSGASALLDHPSGLVGGAVFDVSAADDAADGRLEDAARRLALAGASVVGMADGATAQRITWLRAGVDAAEKESREATESADATWRAAVQLAADRAPGGRAAWIGEVRPDLLPEGFAWTVVPASELSALPERTYLLVVASTWHARLPDLLEAGGMVLTRGADALRAAALTVSEVTDDGAEPIVLARRA